MVSLSECKRARIKCVVWDLDETIWHGIVAEGDVPVLKPEIAAAIRELDRRGILQSVASRNDPLIATKWIEQFGLTEYMLCPQIGWCNKSEFLALIANGLNIGIDSFAFVDDQAFERYEVTYHHPGVLAIEADEAATLVVNHPAFMPRFVTTESARRRQMYQVDQLRRRSEEELGGDRLAFLRTLEMRLAVVPAGVQDLQRAEELTVRTNQLNTTCRTYSFEELSEILNSPCYRLYVARLDDRFGPYGTIGLALVEVVNEHWLI